MKICIVGGVAGGASAATRLRRLDEKAEIVLFEKGEHISYANCGLPYYLGGTIRQRDSLIVTKPELLCKRFRVDVRTRNEVIRINRQEKKIVVRDLKSGTDYEESYDKLILSPGAGPKVPPLPGMHSDGVFTLRNVTDTYRIDDYLLENTPKTAVVVGGGFIGVEMAENLVDRGLSVTLVEYADQVIASLDPEMANILHRHLSEHGVNLMLGTGITGISRDSKGLHAGLTSGEEVDAGLVLLCMGVAPDSHLAKEAGLDLGVNGSIEVNEYYETSDPDIYAVGDAISVTHLVGQTKTLVPLAGPANKQGRTAAENALTGRKVKGSPVQGSSVLKVFDLTAASTGLNEKQLSQMGIPYKKTYVHPQSHASYYPGASPISMKMLFGDDGRILGAQAVGAKGVEKRIDVLAVVIRLGGTVYDLEQLELCYAPPYSSAKDPVNMLGYTAVNILNGDMPVFYAEEVSSLDPQTATLLDVSTPDEILMGTIPGFRSIPLDTLRENLNRLDPEKPVYVTCRVGLRGYLATRILLQNGFRAYNLSGGYRTYSLTGPYTAPAPAESQRLQSVPPHPAVPDTAKPNAGAAGNPVPPMKLLTVDACGLQCPGPIMKVSENMKTLKEGEQLCVQATDPAFASDIGVWCQRTGNCLIHTSCEKGIYQVVLQKGDTALHAAQCDLPSAGNDKTMVIFSQDLDKAIASFIIANGAAAMDRRVTMFFTFWGLNILRKPRKVSLKKTFMEKMFSGMMPRGSQKLKLSHMQMGGIGARLIRKLMKDKNVASLEELIASAQQNGVRIVACQMSMDLMGIRKEELIDGVEIGGVATFLGAAETSDTNLFI